MILSFKSHHTNMARLALRSRHGGILIRQFKSVLLRILVLQFMIYTIQISSTYDYVTGKYWAAESTGVIYHPNPLLYLAIDLLVVLILAGFSLYIEQTDRHQSILAPAAMSILLVLAALFLIGFPAGYSLLQILSYVVPVLSDYSRYWSMALIVLIGYSVIRRYAPELKIARLKLHIFLLVLALLVPDSISYFHTHWYEGTDLIFTSDLFSASGGILGVTLQYESWTEFTYSFFAIRFGQIISFGSFEILVSFAFIVYIFKFIRREASRRKTLLLGVLTFLPTTIIGLVGTIGNLITVPDHSVFYVPLPLPILFIAGWWFMRKNVGYVDPPEDALAEDEDFTIEVPLRDRLASQFRKKPPRKPVDTGVDET